MSNEPKIWYFERETFPSGYDSFCIKRPKTHSQLVDNDVTTLLQGILLQQRKKTDKGQHARCLSSSTRNWATQHVAMFVFFSLRLFTTCPQLSQGLTCPAYQHAPSGICFWSTKASAFLQSADRGMNWQARWLKTPKSDFIIYGRPWKDIS